MTKPLKKVAAKRPAKVSSAKGASSGAPRKPQQPPTVPVAYSIEKHSKERRIKGRFAMPINDYALIGALKAAARASGLTLKKNDVLRAGLRALSAMPQSELANCLAELKAECRADV